MATRYLEGGRPHFLELVQMSALNGDEDAIKWLYVFKDLRVSEQAIVSYDDVCAAAGVAPSDLMAVVVSTAMTKGRDVGNLVAAATHPDIVSQAAKSARRIDGKYADIAQQDRSMLFQHHGFIPVPRHSTMQVNVNASANAAAAAVASAEPSVPSFLTDVEALQAPKEAIQKRLATEGEVVE